MDFSFTKEQQEFRNNLINIFQSEEMQTLIKNIKLRDIDTDAREIYRLLGDQGLLAPNLPRKYGGLDKSLFEAAIVVEEMSNNGVPESLHVLSSLIVGNLLLLSATEEQKQKYLPDLAKGVKNAVILYSEPRNGSDLSSLEASANANNNGEYVLNGRKVYSVKTHLADYGLFAARTSKKSSRYDGLTLFMVPLKEHGVTINSIPSLSDESLFEVVLNNVKVTTEDMIGSLDEGWAIINKALSVERTGLDYFVKAQRWFTNICDRELKYSEFNSETKLIEMARLRCKLDASRYLTYKVLDEIESSGSVDESVAAISKWYASELACEIVWKGQELTGLESCISENHSFNPIYGSLEASYRETPGLTLSAGTSEMMLETISKFRLNISN